MNVIEKLQQDGTQDLKRARNFLTATELLSYTMDQLTGLGFRPTLQCTSGGLIGLTVDLRALDPGHLSASGQGPIEAIAAPPAKNEAPSPPAASEPEIKPTQQAEPMRRAQKQAKPKATPALKTGALSAAEKTMAIEMMAAGAGSAAVARKLGRAVKQLANIKYRNKALIAAQVAKLVKKSPKNTQGDEGGSAVAGTKDRSPPTGAICAPMGSDSYSNLTPAERTINAHLNALGYAGGWSPADDLSLVENLVRGDDPDGTAAQLRVPRRMVIARWKALNTEPGSLDHQARLIRVLKLRAHAAVPLAAE